MAIWAVGAAFCFGNVIIHLMRYPNLNEEKKLWKKGYKRVACLDEAGRGPLAGPVTAAAVMIKNPNYKIQIPNKIQNSKFQFLKRVWGFSHWDLIRNSDLGFRILLNEVKDSKKLSPKVREELYKLITKNNQIKWGIGVVSEKVIDKINIKNAAELAMEKAIKKLKADYLIIDGLYLKNTKLKSMKHKMVVGGDDKVFSCAAASILAKVTRDRIMIRYHKKYPKYRFDLHKGYPTKLHKKMLKKYGPCKIHRKSFKPVAKCI